MIYHYTAGNQLSHKGLGDKLRDLKPGEYVIEIKRNHPIRSIGANRYYWGVVLKVISLWCGEDTTKLHKDYCLRFNQDELNYPNGERRVIPGETKNLNKADFAKFVERVKADARMFFGGINFPEEKDVDYQKWMQIQEEHSQQYDGL